MKNKKFASFLAAAAALVLLAMPAFAADEQTELPAAEAAEVQQEQTAAPAEQETALPADAQTAGEPEQQLTYVALGDSITSGVGLADMKYNIAQIGYDLQPNFEGYSSQCYTALVGKGLGLDRQHAINLGLPGLMSPDMVDMVQNSAMPKMNQASGAYYVYPEYQEYLRKADIISIQIGSNDALVPCIVGLGEATNWKSEQLAALMVSGALRDFNFQKLGLFLEALNRMTLTFDESRATNRLLFRGMDEICQCDQQPAADRGRYSRTEPGCQNRAAGLYQSRASAARMEPLFQQIEPLCQRPCHTGRLDLCCHSPCADRCRRPPHR